MANFSFLPRNKKMTLMNYLFLFSGFFALTTKKSLFSVFLPFCYPVYSPSYRQSASYLFFRVPHLFSSYSSARLRTVNSRNKKAHIKWSVNDIPVLSGSICYHFIGSCISFILCTPSSCPLVLLWP
jgi:hypothetical protein